MQHFGIGYRHMAEDVLAALNGLSLDEGRRLYVLHSMGTEMRGVAQALDRASTPTLVPGGDPRSLDIALGLRRLMPGMDVAALAEAARNLSEDIAASEAGVAAARDASIRFVEDVLAALATRDLFETRRAA